MNRGPRPRRERTEFHKPREHREPREFKPREYKPRDQAAAETRPPREDRKRTARDEVRDARTDQRAKAHARIEADPVFASLAGNERPTHVAAPAPDATPGLNRRQRRDAARAAGALPVLAARPEESGKRQWTPDTAPAAPDTPRPTRQDRPRVNAPKASVATVPRTASPEISNRAASSRVATSRLAPSLSGTGRKARKAANPQDSSRADPSLLAANPIAGSPAAAESPRATGAPNRSPGAASQMTSP